MGFAPAGGIRHRGGEPTVLWYLCGCGEPIKSGEYLKGKERTQRLNHCGKKVVYIGHGVTFEDALAVKRRRKKQ